MMIKTQLPADNQQRLEALDPTRSFIVQAPAGSGKTGLLVRRYLTLLAQVAKPEEILAITFTRKATAEMRSRILSALKGEDTDDNMIKLAKKALNNDQHQNWNILHNPSRLKIQTIDALCYDLVKRMPWSARFGAAPEVLEQQASALIYEQAAKRTLAYIEGQNDWSAHCANLLALSDAHFGKAQSLLAGMLSKRDRWMRGLEINTRAEYEMMWQEVVEQQLELTAQSIPDEVKAEIVALVKFAAANPYERKPNVELVGCLQMNEFPQPLIENSSYWCGIATLLLTKERQVRKMVDVRLGFPAAAKAEKERMKSLLETIATHAGAVQALSRISLLPDDTFTTPQWQMLESLLKLLPLAAAELRLLFKENNQADYVEVAQRAELALGETDSPSNLALVFDYQIKHLLVDEVQDTSQAQFDLLTKLTKGWQYDDGRTLFFVGDPMQSIYRFREAEVGLFLEIQKNGIGEIKPQTRVLETNFRSERSLVEWYNTTFSAIFPAQNDPINGAICYAPSSAWQADTDSHSGVHIHPEIADSDSEATRIGEQVQWEIEALKKQNPQAKIGILGRTRTHLVAITQTLRQKGIEFQATELESLIERPAIQDLMALTRGLIQLNDRIAWLSILRAPWCGMTLQDMSILGIDDHRSSIMALCKDDNITARLSDDGDGKKRLTRLLEKLEIPLSQRGRVSLRKNVEAAWLNLAGPACINESDIPDCESYFDLLGKLENDYPIITATILSDAVAKLWSQTNNESAVQVLTIHKSKGLEFDVVFLPQLHRPPRSPERELIRWTRLPKQLLIAPLPPSQTASDAEADKFYQYLSELEQSRAQNELCRLLYVACTRAKKKLHLYMELSEGTKGKLNPPRQNSLLHLLWAALETEITQHLSAASTSAQVSPVPESVPESVHESAPVPETKLESKIKRLPLKWQLDIPCGIPSPTSETNPQSESKPIEFSWAGETVRIIGIAIHKMLQHIDHQNWQQWKSEATDTLSSRNRITLLEHGLHGEQLEIGMANMRTAIENLKSDEKADWIFSSTHEQVKREWALTAVVNQKISSIVIDRSFIDQHGVRWIIDFKSSHHKGDIENFIAQEKTRYQPQLEHYATIAKIFEARMTEAETTEERKIKLGLYFPLLKGWCEWSPIISAMDD